MAVCLDSLLLDMSGPCASQPVHILLIRLEVIDDLCLCVCVVNSCFGGSTLSLSEKDKRQ